MKNKKIILIIVMFLLTVLNIDYKPQTVESKPDAYEVIKYMNNDLYDYPDDTNDFYLLFDSYKLDSKNFVAILSYLNYQETKIIEVYPYINPLYQTMLNSIYVIRYDSSTLSDGISSIYDIYMKQLEKNRLDGEIDKVLINGVRIRMLKINTSNKIVNSFIKKYLGVKYSLTPYGHFKSYEL